jgi:hypothetical protein
MALRDIEYYGHWAYYHAAGFPDAENPTDSPHLFQSTKLTINTNYVAQIEELTHGWIRVALDYGGGFSNLYLRMSIDQAKRLFSS